LANREPRCSPVANPECCGSRSIVSLNCYELVPGFGSRSWFFMTRNSKNWYKDTIFFFFSCPVYVCHGIMLQWASKLQGVTLVIHREPSCFKHLNALPGSGFSDSTPVQIRTNVIFAAVNWNLDVQKFHQLRLPRRRENRQLHGAGLFRPYRQESGKINVTWRNYLRSLIFLEAGHKSSWSHVLKKDLTSTFW
jgi:hypothetical protein